MISVLHISLIITALAVDVKQPFNMMGEHFHISWHFKKQQAFL